MIADIEAVTLEAHSSQNRLEWATGLY